MITRIRLSRIFPRGEIRQVWAFRVYATQDEAEKVGHALATRWMSLNPGVPTILVTDWPTSEEQGGDHEFAMPTSAAAPGFPF